MAMKLSRRAALAGLLSSVASAAFSDPPLVSLRPKARAGSSAPAADRFAPPTIDEIIAEADLSGVVSFVLSDAATGEILAQKYPAVALPPASIAKALTAQYALSILGPRHRFITRLLATGPIEDGFIRGDLVLAGGADPTLSADHLDQLLARLETLGIKGAEGLLLWDGALPKLPEIDTDQQDHLGYNPTISGLNLNFNQVQFEWQRQGGDYRVTMDARTRNLRPIVTTSRMRVIDRSLPVYTYESRAGRDEWTVARAALGNGGLRRLPVRNPVAFTGEVFAGLAAARGLALPEPQRITTLPPGIELTRHESPPLDKMLADLLLYSTNLTAEIVGLSATLARGLEVSSLASSARAMNRWYRARYGVAARLVDHSGLSDDSRISTLDLTRILRATDAGGGRVLAGLLKNIDMLDAERQVIEGHPVQVRAKTGTLNFVSTLAGYIEGSGGRGMVFAIIAADLAARAAGQAAGDEVPAGSRRYNRRAKRLQQQLLQRWGLIYRA